MSSEHLPLPWRILDTNRRFRDGTPAVDIQSYAADGLGEFVAVKVRLSDAEFIVRACNAHYDLVEIVVAGQ